MSPPARVHWGARGAAPAARPHCDVAGPRQRLCRPPGLLRPPLSPSVRPSLPPSSRAPVSPGPPQAPQGGEEHWRPRLSPCNFAPGDTLRVLGTPGAPFVPRVPSAWGRAVPLQRATRGDHCGNPGSFTPGDPSRSRLAVLGSGAGDCSFHWPLRWLYACCYLGWSGRRGWATPRFLGAPREGRRHGDSCTSNQNNNKREGDAGWYRYPRGAPGPSSLRRLGCPVQPRLLLPALSGVPGLSMS